MASFIAAAAVIYIYQRFDPANSGWFPRCPSKLITGYDCPGCGSQRAIHAILNGDIAGAVRHNAILIVAIPMIIILWTASLLRERYPRFYSAMNSSVTAYATLAVITAWAIIRNIIGI